MKPRATVSTLRMLSGGGTAHKVLPTLLLCTWKYSCSRSPYAIIHRPSLCGRSCAYVSDIMAMSRLKIMMNVTTMERIVTTNPTTFLSYTSIRSKLPTAMSSSVSIDLPKLE
eukprot:1474175-Rhodomonas_salina.5